MYHDHSSSLKFQDDNDLYYMSRPAQQQHTFVNMTSTSNSNSQVAYNIDAGHNAQANQIAQDEQLSLLLFVVGVFFHIVMFYVFFRYISSPSPTARRFAKYAGYVLAFYFALYCSCFCLFFIIFSMPTFLMF